ncbi:hypothetical protein AB0E08_06080 [Streptomyces sp. NPDC048281]|uniref:hypothetical protein n=1 Tax=Streptomyces sp. NPDC048281 TaxID=3154715 RepID=UPI003446B736
MPAHSSATDPADTCLLLEADLAIAEATARLVPRARAPEDTAPEDTAPEGDPEPEVPGWEPGQGRWASYEGSQTS